MLNCYKNEIKNVVLVVNINFFVHWSALGTLVFAQNLSHFYLQVHQVNSEEKRSQNTFSLVFVVIFGTEMSRIGTLHAQQANFKFS